MDAERTYNARQAEVASLLAKLEDVLFEHTESAKAAPKDWGYPGDLARVAESLREVLVFLNAVPEA